METQESKVDRCFVPIGGMLKVFQPGCNPDAAPKKYPCPDCHYCQSCGESRCQSCRSQAGRHSGPVKKKLSLREQILLFERINAKAKDE